jgi:GNAT superfamily N-acetyltransferase
MFEVLRANRTMMTSVAEIINSNGELYESIVDPADLAEHRVDEAWSDRNYPIREFYLGRVDGQFVAAASYQRIGEIPYVGYFYVHRDHHRHGYGKALMRFLVMRARVDDAPKITLFCNPRATWAVDFYTRFGFGCQEKSKAAILALIGGGYAPFYEQGAWLMEYALPVLPDRKNNTAA